MYKYLLQLTILLFVSMWSDDSVAKSTSSIMDGVSGVRIDLLRDHESSSKMIMADLRSASVSQPELPNELVDPLGVAFMKGAVPIAIGAYAGALYNPYCDVAIIILLKKSTASERLLVADSFAVSGDTLSKLSRVGSRTPDGQERTNSGRLSYTERVKSRVAMLSSWTAGKSFSDTKEEATSQNDRLLMRRYETVLGGIGELSDQQLATLDRILAAMKGGDVKALKKFKILPATLPDDASAPPIVQHSYGPVFSIGYGGRRAVFLENDFLPMLAFEVVFGQGGASIEDVRVLVYTQAAHEQ